jgi:copper/silver efflux system protein
MLGGMVSSTVLTLLVIPAVYGLVKGWRLPRTAAALVTAAPDYRDHALSDRPAE